MRNISLNPCGKWQVASSICICLNEICILNAKILYHPMRQVCCNKIFSVNLWTKKERKKNKKRTKKERKSERERQRAIILSIAIKHFINPCAENVFVYVPNISIAKSHICTPFSLVRIIKHYERTYNSRMILLFHNIHHTVFPQHGNYFESK